jgi:hypothetical protein
LQSGAQAPDVQLVEPLAFVQLVTQLPQLLVVVSDVSQPLAELPSQLPQPELQVPSVQTPPTQLSLALARSQTLPQPPQLDSVLVLVSQPLFGLPSQLAQPVAQLGLQVPLVQVVVPLALVQAVPQTPQLLVVFRLVSQPLAALLSQLPQPALQVIEQAPSEQEALPFVLLQALLQVPQLLRFVWRLVSQPSAVTPLQLPHPELQVPSTQLPVEHDSAALARSQSWPQAPQLASVLRVVSQPLAGLPSQSPVPAAQPHGEQVPATQLVVVPPGQLQTVPQAPQLVELVFLSTSQPLLATPSQFKNPVLQVPSVQLPVEHDSLAFARSQMALHAPQLLSVLSAVSQPLAELLSQLPQPARQLPSWQTPPKQLALAFAKLQPLLHDPQWVVDVLRSVSQPLVVLPSQLPQPDLQVIAQTPPLQLGVPFVELQTLPQPPQLLTFELMSSSQPLPATPSQSPQPALHPVIVQTPVEQDSEGFG